MNPDPLITIIIPVYNGAKYIQECIESVQVQSYRNIEIIIVDDGSTDDTPAILRQVASRDDRVKIFSLKNQGPSGARNYALDNMNGDYVTFIDADDIVSHNYIEVLFMLVHETKAEIAAVSFTRTFKRLGLHNEVYNTIDSATYVSKVLYQRLSDNSVWGKLFKSDMWNGIRFKTMRYEDLEIFPRICLKAQKVTYTKAPLYFYRYNETGFINTISGERFDSLKATAMIHSYLTDNNNIHLVNAALSRQLAASFNAYLLSCDNPEYKDYSTESWNNIKRLRWDCFTDPHVKLKIKLGILTSLTGRRFMKSLNSLLHISK